MKKASTKRHSHHDKDAEPVKVPKHEVQKEFAEPLHLADESKPIEEAVTPPAEDIGNAERNCKRTDCNHSGAMHYGSKDRWCNTSGCICEEFV